MTSIHFCRLCKGTLLPKFKERILRRHDVQFFECVDCRSLQTEQPYWLKEAYHSSLSRLDTGAGQRNLTCLAAAFTVAKLFGARNAIDFGGGDGLLCRLLRDYGLNCYVNDKFAAPSYAQGYTEPNFVTPDLLTAFEVVEHFSDPAVEWSAIFDTGARVVLVMTGVYEGQGRDWWYLAKETGQHVFFYSREALELVGKRYGYVTVQVGRFTLFTRKTRPFLRCLAASILLRRYCVPFIRAAMQLLPAPGVGRDLETQRSL